MSGVPAAEKMVLKMISRGTASSAPVVPQIHAQKLSDTRISSGFTSILRPTIIGVIALASTRCRPMKIAGGSIAAQTSGKVIRPPMNSSIAETIGPRYGM